MERRVPRSESSATEECSPEVRYGYDPGLLASARRRCGRGRRLRGRERPRPDARGDRGARRLRPGGPCDERHSGLYPGGAASGCGGPAARGAGGCHRPAVRRHAVQRLLPEPLPRTALSRDARRPSGQGGRGARRHGTLPRTRIRARPPPPRRPLRGRRPRRDPPARDDAPSRTFASRRTTAVSWRGAGSRSPTSRTPVRRAASRRFSRPSEPRSSTSPSRPTAAEAAPRKRARRSPPRSTTGSCGAPPTTGPT